jgi:uncharacterized protein (DUF697 family)
LHRAADNFLKTVRAFLTNVLKNRHKYLLTKRSIRRTQVITQGKSNMAENTASQQVTLVTHALMVGLTPLIPLPLADDMAKQYLQQRLVRSLARAHNITIAEEDLPGLLSVLPTRKGCLSGCLLTALTYPFKKLARKIFFFLEVKRAVDVTSYTYHYGYLLDYAMREGILGGPAGRSLAEVDAALDEVCRTAPIKPVEAAVRHTFDQSKKLLLLPVSIIEKQLRRSDGPLTEEAVKAGLRAAKDENQEALDSLTARLQSALSAVPQEHFNRLRERFTAQLNTPRLNA